jgi:hypothetical protein
MSRGNSSGSEGLARKLAQMDLTLHSSLPAALKHGPYQATWSIDDFPLLMEKFAWQKAVVRDIWTIQLTDQQSLSCKLSCYPNSTVYYHFDGGVEVKLEVQLRHVMPDLMFHIDIGLLNKDGKEIILNKMDCQASSTKAEVSAYKPQADLIAYARKLMPDGRLTIFVRLTFPTWSVDMVRTVAKGRGRSMDFSPQQGSPVVVPSIWEGYCCLRNKWFCYVVYTTHVCVQRFL